MCLQFILFAIDYKTVFGSRESLVQLFIRNLGFEEIDETYALFRKNYKHRWYLRRWMAQTWMKSDDLIECFVNKLQINAPLS